MTLESIGFRPGLEGIPATQSAISNIDGTLGILSYRGYNIADLAANSSFLETAYLLIWGTLPDPESLRSFQHNVQMHRRVSFRIRDMMKCFPASGHPMDALQASAASLGLFYSNRALDDPDYISEAVVRLLAKIPTMLAAFQLIRRGQDPIQPREDLPYASNFLYMLTEQEPDPLAARIFDACLVLHAEHTLNASTFSARVTASTLTDPYAVVASAVGTLAGPLHGGANEMAMEMLKGVAQMDILHVPYKGNAQTDLAVLANEIQTVFGSMPALLEHVKAGKLTPLAVGSSARSPALPDVPAVAETVKGFEVSNWQGIVVPAKTPQAIIRKLHADLAATMKLPAMAETMLQQGQDAAVGTPEQFGALIRSEIETYTKLVKAAGIKAD
jgi:hypothetical protein